MFSFGHCPNRGGETPTQIFFGPFFHQVTVPLYFDINIMLCDTFWSFLTPKSSKNIKIMITFHWLKFLLRMDGRADIRCTLSGPRGPKIIIAV